jgi:Flp pilus assembly protein TadG
MTATRRRRRGQSLVEFALVAPLFFLLLFGIIEAGRFIFHYELLNSATRDGARYAIVHGAGSADPASEADIQQVVLDSAITIVDDGNLDVVVTWPLSNERGDPVTVGAEYAYDPIMPMFPDIDIEVESTLVINN